MSLEIRMRSYDWRDLLRLPFACAPFCTMAVVGQKLLTGTVNVIWVLAEAKCIDMALACAGGNAVAKDIFPLLAVMLLIIIWKRMGWNLGRLLSGKLRLNAEYQAYRETVKKRSRLPYSLVENNRTWEMAERVQKDLGKNISSMLVSVCDFLMAVVRITGVTAIIFWESRWLGLLMVLIMVPLIYISVKSGGRIYTAYQEASVADRRGEYLQGILLGRDTADERTLFGYTDYVDREWNGQQRKARNLYLKAEGMQELRKAGSGVLVNVVSTGMVLFLLAELLRGNLEIGIFIALSKAIYDVISLLYHEMGYSISGMSRYMAFLKEIEKFAALRETEGTDELPGEEPFVFEKLEIRGVSFRYPGTEQYIIKDLTMELKKGQHYALVGENGAGKTTLTKLLTGLYDEYEGEIILNGVDLRNYTPAQLKSVFSCVFQDFARYPDTAANNILLGDIRHMESEEARERLKTCACRLNIYEELRELPEGLDTPLGKFSDHSADLSGGQWQRMAMARSLMNPAPIQILDEPTAALDPISESRLYEEFENISMGRTTIFISHRLGATKLADKIFVLKGGKVAETGTHEKLMAEGGLYAQMFLSQKSWYENDGEEELHGVQGGDI